MAVERRGSVVVVKAVPAGIPLAAADPFAGVPGAAARSIEERQAIRAKEGVMNEAPAIKMRTLTRMEHPEDGRRLEPPGSDGKGAEFEVHSEQTALTLVERRVAERIFPEIPKDGKAAETTGDDETAGPWTLSMEPETYLKRFGDSAQHSAHAKAVLERGEGGQ